jgi:hypothetical protein
MKMIIKPTEKREIKGTQIIPRYKPDRSENKSTLTKTPISRIANSYETISTTLQYLIPVNGTIREVQFHAQIKGTLSVLLQVVRETATFQIPFTIYKGKSELVQAIPVETGDILSILPQSFEDGKKEPEFTLLGVSFLIETVS